MEEGEAKNTPSRWPVAASDWAPMGGQPPRARTQVSTRLSQGRGPRVLGGALSIP